MTGDWDGKQVLVTGAGGFIASHLVEALAAGGARVRAFVRYNSRGDPGLLRMIPKEALSKVEVMAGDLRDLPAVQAAVRGCSHVFHLGALISIPYSYVHPAEVVETNVMGTLNVLMAAAGAAAEAAGVEGIERLVHTSSSEVYGTALRVPIDEEHPLQGQSPYSASKIGADKLAESFYRAYDLPVVTLRPFNTYGPRQSARAVIPTIITQALSGDTIYLGNLEARRDLTYVSDTVEAFLKVGQAEGVEGETINLGTGSEASVGELAEMIGELVGRRVTIRVDEARLRPEKSEVGRLMADNRRAMEMIGWAPQVGLRDGLGRTIEWMRGHMEHYLPGQYQV